MKLNKGDENILVWCDNKSAFVHFPEQFDAVNMSG